MGVNLRILQGRTLVRPIFIISGDKAMKDKPLLTIGMIFRNDIRCLERCLKALEPLRAAIPCELIMADTGSDDGSREVVECYADILFDFPWIFCSCTECGSGQGVGNMVSVCRY